MASTFIRHAILQDIPTIHTLAADVQAALTATGTQQVIAPLHNVDKAVEQQGCFVLEQHDGDIIGCVILRPLTGDHYLDTDFIITAFPGPRFSLHAMMVAPSVQGRGIGKRFLQEVMDRLRGRAKAVLLDCFAGNGKLRDFYTDAGCALVGTARENDYDVAIFVYNLTSEG